MDQLAPSRYFLGGGFGTESCNCIEKLAAVADHGNAQFFEVLGG
jgi:hypothetical protein